MTAITESELLALVELAIYAPSADNSQPLQYQITDNVISLYIDKIRSGLASDNRFILSDIALGAAIENISIGAQANHINTEITLLPDEANEYLVARIICNKSEQTQLPLFARLASFIKKRATDRRIRFFSKIPKDKLQALEQHSSQQNSINIYQGDDKKSLISTIRKAESIRFESKILHQELFSTVKFDEPDAKEGMPVSVLAIEWFAQPFFKLMSNWKWMNRLNKIGASKMLGHRSVGLPIQAAPNLLLITSQGKSRQDILSVGRMLQRIWLEATAQGISVQPYAAPGIFSLGFVNCEEQFKPEMKVIAEELKAYTPDDHYAVMFLKLDVAKPLIHRTNRRKLESFKYQ